MSKLPILFLSLLLLVGLTRCSECPPPNADGSCHGQHCSARAHVVNQMCKDLWKRIGASAGSIWPVYVECGDGFCHCKCSCPAGNTPVMVPGSQWTAIEDIELQTSVMVLGEGRTWEPATVTFSDGTPGTDPRPVPNMIRMTTSGGHDIVTTADHLFLIEGWSLRRADRLTTRDKVIDAATLRPIAITAIGRGHHIGSVWNIATTTDTTGSESMWGHLINTAGIVSGDFYAELHLSDPTDLTLASVGSSQYERENANAQAATRLLASANFFPSDQKWANTRARLADVDVFSFVPEEMEKRHHKLADISVSEPLEVALSLANQFSLHYPDVVFHIEDYWTDDTANAKAWREGSVQHVALLGGLIRHPSFSASGLAIVLAHELGHHFAGEPTYPNSWASCEGQSDYWGCLIPMRQVFWAGEAIRRIREGAEEAFEFFGGESGSGSSDPCGHPRPSCRRDLYLAAARADPKPNCEGSANADLKHTHQEL